MAKITKETVIKMNNRLFNGFKTDIQKLVMGDKMAVKKVTLDEKNYLVASLWFGNEYENYKKVSNTIELNVSLYTKDDANSEIAVSHGLGHTQTIETGLVRKTWKQLAMHTKDIDEAYILDIHAEHEAKMKMGRIV